MNIRWPKTTCAQEPEQPLPMRRQLWLVTAISFESEHTLLLYRGVNLAIAEKHAEDARRGGLLDVAILDGGYIYPPPHQQPGCKCAESNSKANVCLYGHEHECHYPLGCAQADCAWMHCYDGDESKDVVGNSIDILPSDRMFGDSPEPGPKCPCSRCGEAITDAMLRVENAENEEYGEWRFHPSCVGL